MLCIVLHWVIVISLALTAVVYAYAAASKMLYSTVCQTDCVLFGLLSRRRRGPFDPEFLQLLSHVLLGTVLSKIVPFIYGAKPALLKLGSTTRYSEITAAVRRDSLLAAVGFAALGLWLSLKIAAKFMAA
jgi:hypothetical protein